MNNKVPYIMCAAIYYDDGNKYPHQPKNIETGMIICGHRHHVCFVTIMHTFPNRDKNNIKQGFLTSDNRFVSRIEAAKIAYDCGQTEIQLPSLFSEDLW